MKFNDNYGVYVCPHVFNQESPVFVCVRDPDGDWQFFCHDEECPENSEPHLIGVGHLTEADPSINELTTLAPNTFAERQSPEEPWLFGEIE
ncbi:hypothetical protein [Thalassotalea mangrovi]|uniref:DUF2185 domain-containing protein n=1 Tax=Thalassotalea mangrovi TaxID=2572245 RepID=A0A4U1B5T7_9GAMM|nr:hypothetical protein [Thalassotalea mangrovi]TKB45849.1 hypothetical protein E8M12_06275 [Thalassotalea mangrovi]